MSFKTTTIFTKSVSDPWFSLIATGSKEVEGRLNKGDFAHMHPGDHIDFINDSLGVSRRVRVKIMAIKTYKTFRDYLQHETLARCLPTIKDLDQGVAIYHKFYSVEDEKKYGICAITISPVE